MPFCPPAGRILQRLPWNPFAGLPGDLRATFQRAPLHALLVSRSCIEHEEALSLFPHWMAAVAQAFDLWIRSWVARDTRHSGSGPAWCRRSRGPRCVVPR